MSDRRRLLPRVLVGLSLLYLPVDAASGLPLDTVTVGVYDPGGALDNGVDASATGYNVAMFTADVLIAFNGDNGGVISFDDIAFAGFDAGPINATYGTTQNKTLTITSATSVGAVNVAAIADATAISGSKGLSRVAPGSGFDLSFAAPVDALGVTVLSDDTKVLNITARITLTTNAVFGAIAILAQGQEDHDTFFAFKAPAGTQIKRLEILEAGSNQVYLDDLGFYYVAVPEPFASLLLGSGLIGLVARQRLAKA